MRSLVITVLTQHFAKLGYVLFDATFNARPLESTLREWGGYEARFKLMPSHQADDIADLEQMRREATISGAGQRRTFQIQISKYEYCDTATVVELDGATVRIYTPVMLIAEKLRAICQQIPDYPLRRHPTPRARDFYDICGLVDLLGRSLDIRALGEVLCPIFQAKSVEITLLADIRHHRAFHEVDWPAVQATARERPESFDHYFDRVVELIDQLHLAGIV